MSNYELKSAIETKDELHSEIKDLKDAAQTVVDNLIGKVEELNGIIDELNQNLAEDASPGATLSPREIKDLNSTAIESLAEKCAFDNINVDAIANEAIKIKFNEILENFEEGVIFTKKIAKEYNLPEAELLEKHKTHFLEEFSQKSMELECYIIARERTGYTLSDISKNVESYPEITTMFLKDAMHDFFAEHMITSCYERDTHLYRKACDILHFMQSASSVAELKLKDDVQNSLLENASFQAFHILYNETINGTGASFMKEANQKVAEKIISDKSADKAYANAIRANSGKSASGKATEIQKINQFFINNKIDLSQPVSIVREQFKSKWNFPTEVHNDTALDALHLAQTISKSIDSSFKDLPDGSSKEPEPASIDKTPITFKL